MNRNSKIKRKLTASLAVGMSVMMSAVPVLAADQEVVYKDETIYCDNLNFRNYAWPSKIKITWKTLDEWNG